MVTYRLSHCHFQGKAVVRLLCAVAARA